MSYSPDHAKMLADLYHQMMRDATVVMATLVHRGDECTHLADYMSALIAGFMAGVKPGMREDFITEVVSREHSSESALRRVAELLDTHPELGTNVATTGKAGSGLIKLTNAVLTAAGGKTSIEDFPDKWPTILGTCHGLLSRFGYVSKYDSRRFTEIASDMVLAENDKNPRALFIHFADIFHAACAMRAEAEDCEPPPPHLVGLVELMISTQPYPGARNAYRTHVD